MSERKGTARDIAMKGAGYYSKATTGARDVIDAGLPFILDALEAMDQPDDGQTFTMADMGCADGGTSIGMIGAALTAIRNKWPSRPIQMIYSDLPRNDFSQLFQIVHGQTEIETYYGTVDELYVFASATSFHDGIFPPASLGIGFSATASHYISKKPGVISNHVHMVGATGAERTAYEEQGRADWETFLLRRSRELSSDGRLVLFNFGIDEEGRYLGHTGGVSMFDTFNELWAELKEAGTITEREYLETNFQQCYRTVDQFTAPLTDESNPVFQSGLRLDHVETRVVRCPYERDFSEGHGDADRFAREYIPTLRSWSEVAFATGLSPERPLDERVDILDTFYRAYEDRVRNAPAGHAMDYVHTYLVLRKA
jgi:hypothetical protein